MGNFSRNTFNLLKAPDATGFNRDYRGVRLQMGVPLVDADWNELEDIRKAELKELGAAVIGTGLPAGSNGFAITVLPVAAGAVPNFSIAQGAMVVQGVLVTVKAALQYTQQEYYAGTPAGQQRATQRGVAPVPVLTALPAAGAVAQVRTDIIYLEVWEREVNATEDPRMMDNALLEETSVRMRLEWAVRVAQNGQAMPAGTATHARVPLATVKYTINPNSTVTVSVQDERRKGLTLASMVDQDRRLKVAPVVFGTPSGAPWTIDSFSAKADPPPSNAIGWLSHTAIMPVALPEGARLTGLRIVGKKQGGILWVYFIASPILPPYTAYIYMVPVQIWGTGDNFATLDVTLAAAQPHVVNLQQYNYTIGMLGSVQRRAPNDADDISIGGFEVLFKL